MKNYFSVCFSNTQVRTLISQPLIHGVPEVPSSRISRNLTKIGETIVVNSFLFLEADHFCHNLFPTISQVKGVRKIAHKRKRQNQGTPNKAPFVKNFRSGQRSG
ncbi:hypothetical protein Q3F86_14140, partial [Enterococcus faecium]|nr:hypothetical protein [Enterococcus faecium]